MNKKIDKSLIISSILCISPSILSIFLYKFLPKKLPIHFDINGNIDGYGNTFIVCFIVPILFCMLNIFINIAINNDPNKKNHNKKLFNIFKFIIPTICSIFLYSSILISLGFNIRIEFIIPIFISILFIIIGNYMPKLRQNYTMGIRLPWTLNNQTNWSKTHRFSGFLWVISGIIILLITLINKKISFISLLILISIPIFSPIIYSFSIYKKQKKT